MASHRYRVGALLLVALSMGCQGQISTPPARDVGAPVCDESRVVDPGRAPLRRLNRREYDSTIRDLLFDDSRPARDFPEDPIAYGYDTVGSVLQLPPLLVDEYQRAAESLARSVFEDPPPALDVHYEAEDVGANDPRFGRGDGDEGTALWFTSTAYTSTERMRLQPGRYVLRARIRGRQDIFESPASIGFWIDGELVQTIEASEEYADYEVAIDVDAARDAEFRVGVTNYRFRAPALPIIAVDCSACAGPEQVCVAEYCRANIACTESAECDEGQRCHNHADTGMACSSNYAHRTLYVDHFSVAGPEGYSPSPHPGRARILQCDLETEGEDCVRDTLSTLARRAWRRPLADDDVERLMSLVQTVTMQGDSLTEGLIVATQAILLSPNFIFRVEGAFESELGPRVERLDDHALASRLSYALWGSAPDDRLVELANAGELHEVLEEQAMRMLDDERAGGFIAGFGEQWLQLNAVDGIERDETLFPEWTPALEADMRDETRALFMSFVASETDIAELLTADYTYGSEALAAHYGAPAPIDGRIDLSGTERRGILGHGSILVLTGKHTKTSIVRRGKWVLDTLLCQPPRPPPPEVEGEFEPVDPDASVREQFSQHRADPSCAVCHDAIDPIGFALEPYDTVGAWRTEDTQGFAIDATGVLPDGFAFDGPGELAERLSEEGEFHACVLQQLFVYALGRGIESGDTCELERMTSEWRDAGGSLRALVRTLVRSPAFTHREAAR